MTGMLFPASTSAQHGFDNPGGVEAERRGALRRPEILDVVMYYPGVGVIHAMSRNVGARGMFVETDSAVVLPHHAVLEMFVTIRTGGAEAVCRLSGEVARVSGSGLGLRLRKVDANYSRYIKAGWAA